MQRAEPKIQNSRLLLHTVVALAVLVALGCSQGKQVEKQPASRPNAAIEFDGPGNRVDANFQGTSPK